MRILLISNMYPNEKNPSYGIFVKKFHDKLSEFGIEFEKVVLFKCDNKIMKLINYFKFYINIVLKCCLKKYDCVYVHYASHVAIPILIARHLKHFKLYVNVHGSDVMPDKKSQYKFQKYVKKLLRIADKVIVPSQYFENVVLSKYNLKDEKVFISPSGGVDLKKFNVKNNIFEIKEKLGVSKDKFIIGYIGRIDQLKGWDVFLKGLKTLEEKNLLDDKEIIIVGDGKENDLLLDYINKYNLGKYIKKYGLLSQEMLPSIFNAIDVFCFPTLRLGESLGLVALEAMACGKIIIGSNIAALPEYIKNFENGLLYAPEDYNELANAIKYLSNLDNNKILEMQRNSLEKVKKYDSEVVFKDMYLFLVKTINSEES